MTKQEILLSEYIITMTSEEAFSVAKLAWVNAERLHEAAFLLNENGYIEQAYNNLFIACEEYFKAKSFDSIAYVKKKGEALNEDALKEFVLNFYKHEWKFREAFFDAEMNILNITYKVEDGFDDTEIQNSLHKEMQKTFKFLNELNPYNKKNNSLYIGFNKDKHTTIIPQQVINKDIIEKFFMVCFYVQMTYRVDDAPSGNISFYLKWSGKELHNLFVEK